MLSSKLILIFFITTTVIAGGYSVMENVQNKVLTETVKQQTEQLKQHSEQLAKLEKKASVCDALLAKRPREKVNVRIPSSKGSTVIEMLKDARRIGREESKVKVK